MDGIKWTRRTGAPPVAPSNGACLLGRVSVRLSVTTSHVCQPGQHGKVVCVPQPYKHIMHSISTRFGVDGERRFAVLMIALSVAIFLAICRSERNAT